MGSYVFKWPHPNANEVYVTGTFDDWSKSEKLDKVGETWEKEVQLSNVEEKIRYKFVVDGEWVTDHTAPREDDGHSNVNNILTPEDIKSKTAEAPGAANISTVGPESTTAALAANQPIEKTKAGDDVPGAFPETPANEEQTFGVSPIPASEGVGNPVQTKPGEKIPEQTPTNTVDSTVTTSKEDYEKAGSSTFPAMGGAVAGAVAGVAATLGLTKGDDKKDLIPESSLPMGEKAEGGADAGPTIQSAGAGTTTAGLAAGVPLEQKRQAMVIDPDDAPSTKEVDSSVPKPVKESLTESHQSPEAAASPEAVKDKEAMEKELLSKTSESQAEGESVKAAANQSSYYGLATSVPKPVEESMAEAHASPEAAADPSAVAEKTALESELVKKVSPTEATGAPAPTDAAATSETAPAPTGAAAEPPVPGTLPTAAAAVADGAGEEEPVQAPKTTTTTEKSEADATEYAPPATGHAAPGVSDSAAAAISDGTPDPTLANEPAVQMMNQNEAEAATGTTEDTAKAADPAAPATAPTEEPKNKATEQTPGAGAATEGTAPASATETPAKKTTETPTSSPATTETKEKKKKNRVSAFFKKVFQ